MPRIVRHLAASLAAIMLSAGLAAAPAQAGPQHYGTDPYHTGCSGNSFAYRSFPIYNTAGQAISARAELWYSRTCATNWVVVSGNPAGGATDKYIAATNGQWWHEVDYGTGWSYSMQVYAPADVCVEMTATLLHPDGALYATTYPQWVC